MNTLDLAVMPKYGNPGGEIATALLSTSFLESLLENKFSIQLCHKSQHTNRLCLVTYVRRVNKILGHDEEVETVFRCFRQISPKLSFNFQSLALLTFYLFILLPHWKYV